MNGKKEYASFSLRAICRIMNVFCILIFGVLLSHSSNAQPAGCTDPLANNYNPSASSNDGSCLYSSTSIAPSFSFPLDSSMMETSGLICLNGRLLTHNDNDDIHLYYLDTLDGHLLGSDSLKSCINKEWEELSQDSIYFYIGDFGNNSSGNRTDLHILRVLKSSIMLVSPIIDTIYFSYADQTDFSAHAANTTDYDCESFVVSSDSIYLFTKQWQRKQTVVYVLPKTPGNYSAQPRDTFNVNGLITGATYLEQQRLLVLCGYSNLLLPFTYLCYDFQKQDFFGANKRRTDINALAIHQIEGIATSNGLKYYMTNESFVQGSLINSPQAFHIFDFSTYLNGYLSSLLNGLSKVEDAIEIHLYPNPTSDFCFVSGMTSHKENVLYRLLNILGEEIYRGVFSLKEERLDIQALENGLYFIELESPYNKRFSILKQSK